MQHCQRLNVWPVHPRPLPDELLSSWMVRLAHSNGHKTQSFYAFYLGRSAVLWNRDVDRALPPAVIGMLGEKAAISPASLEAMTLRAFNGYVYEDCSVKSNCSWLLALGIRHRLRHAGGMQFCSACLAEDVVPYFRRTWRMAWATACTRHGLLLRDRCPKCSDPIQFHRVDMALKTSLPKNVKLTVCPTCGCDLAKLADPAKACSKVVTLQTQMEQAAFQGFVSFAGQLNLHSMAYFEGMRILASGIAKLLNHSQPLGSVGLELMEHSSRKLVTEHLARTVEEWPRGFTELAASMRHPYAHFLKDRSRAQLPLWLLDEADRTRRSAAAMTAEERSYICTATEAVTGRFSAPRARALFGRDMSAHLRTLPVSEEDAETFVASIDHTISVARGRQRRDLLRDKVLFVTARVLGMSAVQISKLEVSFADDLLANRPAQAPSDVPKTPPELGAWMRWYVDEIRPQFRAADTPWLFLCDGEHGHASDSLVSARFQAALDRSGISRRIGNFSRWGQRAN